MPFKKTKIPKTLCGKVGTQMSSSKNKIKKSELFLLLLLTKLTQ